MCKALEGAYRVECLDQRLNTGNVAEHFFAPLLARERPRLFAPLLKPHLTQDFPNRHTTQAASFNVVCVLPICSLLPYLRWVAGIGLPVRSYGGIRKQSDRGM